MLQRDCYKEGFPAPVSECLYTPVHYIQRGSDPCDKDAMVRNEEDSIALHDENLHRLGLFHGELYHISSQLEPLGSLNIKIKPVRRCGHSAAITTQSAIS